MNRIFFDVGSHHGETIDRMLDPVYKLDRIIGFDPSPACQSLLIAKYQNEPRVEIASFGLWNKTTNRPLFCEGQLFGTIWPDYEPNFIHPVAQIRGNIATGLFVKASYVVHEVVRPGDFVVFKMNCEACECDIVDDLLDSGEYDKLDWVLIDFDVRHVPSQAHRQQEILQRVADLGKKNLRIYEEYARFPILKEVFGLS